MSFSTPVAGILTLACPDQKGIVACVTEFLARLGANILDSCQFNDRSAGTFFMRVQFSLDEIKLTPPQIQQAFKPLATEFAMRWNLHYSDQPQRMAILVSRQEHCLYDLLLRQKSGELNVLVPLIISNHPDLAGVAAAFGIPYYHLPVSNATRERQEDRVIELLLEHNIDLVVLARYMQVLSPAFVRQFHNRIINIHHSFLPAFVGNKPYHQAFERGVKMVGATGHYVTAELDQGPIIAQDVVQTTHRDSINDMIRRGRDLERVVLARAVRAHLECKVMISSNRTIIFE